MHRTSQIKLVQSPSSAAHITDKAPGTAATPADFLFIGGGDDADCALAWQQTCHSGNLSCESVQTDDLGNGDNAAKLRSLLAKLRSMRQQGLVSAHTQIIIYMHGHVINGRLMVTTRLNGQSTFEVEAESFLAELRQALTDAPQQISKTLVHLPCCRGGLLRTLLAKAKGQTLLYMGKQAGLAELAVDTIDRVIRAWSREPRSMLPPATEQIERLWMEVKAHTGENAAWVGNRKMRKHKAIEVVLDQALQTKLDPLKRRHVLYSKLHHGSLDSVKRVLGEAPQQRITERSLGGTAPLFVAAQSQREARPKLDYLIEHLGVNIDEAEPENQQTALHAAAEAGNAEALLGLVMQGADALLADKDGWLPLHSAAQSLKDSAKLIDCLLIADPDRQVDRPGPGGRSALQLAVAVGNMEAVAHLLFRGADPNFKDANGATALDLVPTLPPGQTRDVIRGLLEQLGSRINRLNPEGRTALHLEAVRGDAMGMRALIESGASPYRCDKAGLYPIHLLAAGSKQDTLEKLKLLLEFGPGINDTDINGNSALHLAAMVGNQEAVLALLALGADPAQPSHCGVLPIHQAAGNVVDLLLAAMQSQPQDKPRPAGPSLKLNQIAASSQQRREMRPLLALPGALERRDAQGITPLAAAILSANAHAARYLLRQKAVPNIRLGDGRSLLQHAKAAQLTDMVQLLMEAGADPDW